MPRTRVAEEPLILISAVVVGLVRLDGRDLTARGLAILLAVDTLPGPHTVRGMAQRLAVDKPSITRTLNRLEALNLVRRTADPADGRSVLVRPTRAGSAYVARVGRLAREAAA